MHRVCLLLVATLALAGCGSAPKCATIDAQGVVHASHPKEQFRYMLTAVVERTLTVESNGPTSKAIASAVDASVERHLQEWEHNLVSAWGTLSADELAQVCTALSERDQATYMKFATRVGTDVQTKNEPLLRKAGSEVLSDIF